jgi:hypothetical protein
MPNEIIHDVNSYLGSWGPQPSDHYATPRAVAVADLLTAQDWYELAVRWATEAMIEIRAGHPEMAGEFARGAARFCLKYQLAGGRPDAE